MCSLQTEGTQHGCGHYIITKTVAKTDCLSQFCIHSRKHYQPVSDCPHCPNCKRYLDPDTRETITRTTSAYCNNCEYWYNGPGAQRR